MAYVFGGTLLGTTNNAYIESAIDWYYDTKAENNSTTVTAYLLYRRTNTGYITGGTGSFTITINGTTISKSGVSLEIPSSWVVAMSAEVSVPHNADGTKAVSISATGGLPPSSLTATYCSGTVTLPTIPRVSSITCAEADIESNPLITIKPESTSFTHTITYQFGNLSGTIKEKTTATSITDWTIPADFYTQIPDAKRGYGTLTCYTYSGATLIGSSTCTFWVSTNKEKCKPTVSGSVIDTNATTVALTGDNNILVRYRSTAQCTLSATPNKSAGSITTKTINGNAISGNTLSIPNVETDTFEFYAKDSREWDNNDTVVKPASQVIPYIPITLDVESSIEMDGETTATATIKISGNYFNSSFGAANNHIGVEIKFDDGDWVGVPYPEFDNDEYSTTYTVTLEYTQALRFQVKVWDALTSPIYSKERTLRLMPVFDWGENDFNFNVPVTIMGDSLNNKLHTMEAFDAFTFDNHAFRIGYGIVEDGSSYVGCISFNIGWITLQFKITSSNVVYKRSKYGNNAWSAWAQV